jgi:hypothetical protein
MAADQSRLEYYRKCGSGLMGSSTTEEINNKLLLGSDNWSNLPRDIKLCET